MTRITRTQQEQKEFDENFDLAIFIATPFLFVFGNCVIANSALSIQLIEKEKKEKEEKKDTQLEFRHVLSAMTIIVGIIIDFIAIYFFIAYFVKKAAAAAKIKKINEMVEKGYK